MLEWLQEFLEIHYDKILKPKIFKISQKSLRISIIFYNNNNFFKIFFSYIKVTLFVFHCESKLQ